MPADLPRNRLGLAQWLLRPEHPLTARVTVNRFWQEVFGTGLVKTTGEFGVGGDLPSHPELLDWLAVDFRENGWDVKRLFRLLVLSATYRQAAAVDAGKTRKGPAQPLLSRGPRFRMDGEMVRDYALAASGLLVRKLGGPSVKPYQPDGVWEAVAMIGSNTRDYKHDTGDEALPPQPVHVLEAGRPAGLDGDFQRAQPRDLHGAPRANEYAAASLDDLERSAIRRSRPPPGRAGLARRRSRRRRADRLHRRAAAGAAAVRRGRSRSVRDSLTRLAGYYRQHADDAEKLVSVGDSKRDPSLDVRNLGRLDNAGQRIDEPGRGIEQIDDFSGNGRQPAPRCASPGCLPTRVPLLARPAVPKCG